MMMQNLAAYFSSLSHAERKKLVENHAKEIATWVIKGDGYIIVGVKDNINFNSPELESAILFIYFFIFTLIPIFFTITLVL